MHCWSHSQLRSPEGATSTDLGEAWVALDVKVTGDRAASVLGTEGSGDGKKALTRDGPWARGWEGSALHATQCPRGHIPALRASPGSGCPRRQHTAPSSRRWHSETDSPGIHQRLGPRGLGWQVCREGLGIPQHPRHLQLKHDPTLWNSPLQQGARSGWAQWLGTIAVKCSHQNTPQRRGHRDVDTETRSTETRCTDTATETRSQRHGHSLRRRKLRWFLKRTRCLRDARFSSSWIPVAHTVPWKPSMLCLQEISCLQNVCQHAKNSEPPTRSLEGKQAEDWAAQLPDSLCHRCQDCTICISIHKQKDPLGEPGQERPVRARTTLPFCLILAEMLALFIEG